MSANSDDELLKSMRKSFLANGKVRWASLPSIVGDNKFIQLCILRKESGYSWGIGQDTSHNLDDVMIKSTLSTESRSQQTRSTEPNIYTPLSLGQHLESFSVNAEIHREDPVFDPKSKVTRSSRCSSGNHRSSVRPFFCCGSELSLVSLVDGIDLKDESSIEKSTESFHSSNEEILETAPFRRRSYTVGTVGVSHSSAVRRKKKEKHAVKKKFWSLRLQNRWNPGWRSRRAQHSKGSQQSITSGCSGSFSRAGPSNLNRKSSKILSVSTASSSPFLDFFHFFPVESITDASLCTSARNDEMTGGAGIGSHSQALSRRFQSNVDISSSMIDILHITHLNSVNSDGLRSSDSPVEDLLMSNLMPQVQNPTRSTESQNALSFSVPQIHTQIDYVHYLVPDLAKITACSYYWGIMDRYEAEHLLENKPSGTFLLRDSAQEDFLFSVSFRRYNRSLHARIEQWNHKFSFDAHDPNVFSALTVCDLMEHYKDPSLCMFFEPMLTRPLLRGFSFSLQHISRTVICDRISYNDIQRLPLPNSFKKYLQAYHYKQKVRIRTFDTPEMASANLKVSL